jgi:integrase/recombinase XerD
MPGHREQTPFDDLTEAFTRAKLEAGQNPHYARRVQSRLNALAAHLKKIGRTGWEQVRPGDVAEFCASRNHGSYPRRGMEDRAVINSFLRWASGVPKRPAQRPAMPEPKPGDIDRSLTAEELRLMAAARATPEEALIFTLGYGSGMRAGEIAQLQPGQVDAAKRQAAVRLKGRERIVYLTREAVQLLAAWSRCQRPRRARPDSPPNIILTRRGTAASNKDVNRWMQSLAAKAGVTRRVTSHMLRHTFGAELLEAGAPMQTISRLLGHAEERTTRRYTAARPEWMQNQLAQYHPAHRPKP